MRVVKRLLRWIVEIALLLLCVLAIFYKDLVLYGLSQAKGQMSIVWNARPTEEILGDPAFPDSLKQKLVLIQEIRRFAVDSLGIKDSDNYTTVYDQKGKPILWTVTACEPYELKAKEWRFPVLGSVSYKGFFYKPAAIREAMLLKDKGYDTDIAVTSGWSTLGFFKDPILSNMLYRNEGDLANLIIHELTHATLYVKSSVDFNENLASFVGDQGALRFLEYKFGKESKEYREYVNGRKDEEKYNKYMLYSAARLDSLYSMFEKHPEAGDKESLKKQLLIDIVKGVDKLQLRNKKRYRRAADRTLTSKNAYFMMFIRYDSAQDLFENEFREDFNSDLKAYLEYLKEKYPSI
jgi:predicted aminopeptidase